MRASLKRYSHELSKRLAVELGSRMRGAHDLLSVLTIASAKACAVRSIGGHEAIHGVANAVVITGVSIASAIDADAIQNELSFTHSYPQG